MNSLNELWEHILNDISSLEKYSEATFNLWFKELVLYKLSNTTAYIIVNTQFKLNIIQTRYIEDLESSTAKILGFPVEIALFVVEEGQDIELCFRKHISKKVDEIAENTPLRHSYENVAVPTPFLETEDEEPEEVKTPIPVSPNLKINLDYTFHNFIVGSTNRFAHAACMSVAEHPSEQYNPLYIYGQSGLGKTHLLYAITNKILSERKNYNILYVRGEDFANELIDNISKKKSMNYFREKYRKVDMILIDDIQFIAGKVACQEEFFHTFNALYEDRKQIVMTSDLPPKELKTLEDRLRTRFEWGLIVDIQPPDMELRVAILKNKAQSFGINISNEVLIFLAEHVKNNIRQLEGAVKKLNAFSLLSDSPINMETARMLVSDILSTDVPPTFTTDKIFEIISMRYGVSCEDILSNKRNQEIVRARHIVVYFMRTLCDMTFPAIGKKLNMHHTSVMSAIENIQGKLKSNPSFELEISELLKEIKQSINS